MNHDWSNDPATDEQKAKLAFFGCTWDEGITKRQARDALYECARLFPDLEASYRNPPSNHDPLATGLSVRVSPSASLTPLAARPSPPPDPDLASTELTLPSPAHMMIVCQGDELELSGDSVIIRRRGVANALAVGLQGDRTILISALTSIQMKPCGIFSVGYILFSYAGSRPFMGGVIEATQDPDAFIFDRSLNDQVTAFKAKVEQIMKDSKKTPAAYSSGTLTDELRKLAEFKDQGILSQAEFEAAKKKLLT